MTDTELVGKIIELYAPILPKFHSPSWVMTTTDTAKNEYIYEQLKALRLKERRFGNRLGQFTIKFLFLAITALVVLGLGALIKMLIVYLFF